MHTKGPFLPIYRTLFIRMCHVMMDRVFQKLGFENGHDRAVIQTSYTLKKKNQNKIGEKQVPGINFGSPMSTSYNFKDPIHHQELCITKYSRELKLSTYISNICVFICISRMYFGIFCVLTNLLLIPNRLSYLSVRKVHSSQIHMCIRKQTLHK